MTELSAYNEPVHLKAPRHLGVDLRTLQQTVRYCNSIRANVLAGRDVVVDLSGCEKISNAACLMLCAEVELGRHLRAGSVDGRDPESEIARRALFDIGFHRYLAHPGRHEEQCGPSSLIIHSGTTVTANTAADLAEIADLAKGRLSEALTEAVLACLQEAMINIQDHAYEGTLAPGVISGKWWFAGALLEDGLAFLAYDHGVGIRSKALQTMPAAVEEYWARRNVPVPHSPADTMILEAALNARREGIDVGGRGKGFPFMVNMLERKDATGRLYVVSGTAAARFTRLGQAKAKLQMETLTSHLPGTMFAWQVCSERR